MKKYLVIVEDAGKNFCAYSPDVPGVYATGKTRKDARREMTLALRDHLQWLRDSGDPIRKPSSSTFRIAP